MKKISLGIFALLIAIGFSAFAVIHKKTKPVANDPTYVWHKFNAAGTAELSPVVTYTGTAAMAKQTFGCPDGTAVNCARAYDADNQPLPIYIKKTAQ